MKDKKRPPATPSPEYYHVTLERRGEFYYATVTRRRKHAYPQTHTIVAETREQALASAFAWCM